MDVVDWRKSFSKTFLPRVHLIELPGISTNFAKFEPKSMRDFSSGIVVDNKAVFAASFRNIQLGVS